MEATSSTTSTSATKRGRAEVPTEEELRAKTIPELKALLKESGRLVTGKKEDLIQRLLEVGPNSKKPKVEEKPPLPPMPAGVTAQDLWERVCLLEAQLKRYKEQEKEREDLLDVQADNLVSSICKGIDSQVTYKKNRTTGRILLSFPIEYALFMYTFEEAKDKANSKAFHAKILDDEACKEILGRKLSGFSCSLRYSGYMGIKKPLTAKFTHDTHTLTISGSYELCKD